MTLTVSTTTDKGSATSASLSVSRPQCEKIQNRIIQSACRLFFSRSFGAVSIEQIAADAGVSTVTIYKHFRTKEALLHEAVGARTKELRAACPSPDCKSDKLEDDLITLIGEIRDVLWDDRFISMNRGVAAEIADDAKMQRQMREQFFAEFFSSVEARLQVWIAKDCLAIDDIPLAVDQLCAISRGMTGFELLFGATRKPDVHKNATQNMTLFIAAYGKSAHLTR